MTRMEATREAHRRWHTEGIGIAVAVRVPQTYSVVDSDGHRRQHLLVGPGHYEPTIYQVGITNDEDSMVTFGRSLVSFEDAFWRADAARP